MQFKFKYINRKDFFYYLKYKRSLSQNSLKHINYSYDVFERWIRRHNRGLNKTSVEAFIEYLIEVRSLKGSSVNTYYFFLNNLQKYCFDRDIITDPFLDGFRQPAKRFGVIDVLSVDEIERIISVKRKYANRNGYSNEHLDLFYTTFIMFLALTGCRFSEAAQLKVKYVDFVQEKAIFAITKTHVPRVVYFTEPLKSCLLKLVENKNKDDLVFSYATGKQLLEQTFAAELKKRCKLAGITKRVYPHLFRHSFATELISSGIEITWVASLLGHKQIETTYQHYVHLADNRRKQAMFMHPLLTRGKLKNLIKNTL